MSREFKEFGPLDVAVRSVEEIHDVLARSWNGGNYRMSRAECERLAQYLVRIEVSHSEMRDTLKLYEHIAKRPDAPKLISNLLSTNNEQHENTPMRTKE